MANIKHTLDELTRIDDATLTILFQNVEELRSTGVTQNTLLREWLDNFYLHDDDTEYFYERCPIGFLTKEIYREAAKRHCKGVI